MFGASGKGLTNADLYPFCCHWQSSSLLPSGLELFLIFDKRNLTMADVAPCTRKVLSLSIPIELYRRATACGKLQSLIPEEHVLLGHLKALKRQPLSTNEAVRLQWRTSGIKELERHGKNKLVQGLAFSGRVSD